MNLHETLRAQHIKRWTIVATAKEQSLAEHTFNVTMMAREFCKQMEIDDVTMMKAAMEHDLDEIFTGDIPTPAKERFRDAGIEPATIEGPQKNVEALDPDLKQVLKCLDILESVHFLGDFGIGKRAVAVTEQLKSLFYHKVYEIWDPIIKGVLIRMATEVLTAPEG